MAIRILHTVSNFIIDLSDQDLEDVVNDDLELDSQDEGKSLIKPELQFYKVMDT